MNIQNPKVLHYTRREPGELPTAYAIGRGLNEAVGRCLNSIGCWNISKQHMATSHLFDQPIRGRKGNGMRQTSNPEKENQKQTNQECPRHAWHHASQAHSQALARAGPWAEALEPGPWPFGGSWALGQGLGPGRRAGNAPDLHDASHASDILDAFALDLARLRTPEAVSSPFQAVPRSLETMPS